MRWTQALAGLLIVLLIAACGGGGNGDGNGGDDGGESQAAGDGDDGNGDDGNGDGDDGNGDDGNGDDGDDGNGVSEADLEQLLESLIPPNSSEATRTTAEGVIFVTYQSTDSPEDLEGFYENAIADTGMEVFSTTSAEGSYSWIFAESDGSDNGGVVTVTGDGSGGSVVGIQVGGGG